MKLFKVTSLFALPLLLPVLLSGCGGAKEDTSTAAPAASQSADASADAAKPADAKAEAGKAETIAAAGLQFAAPTGWKVTNETGKPITVESPDGNTAIILSPVEASKLTASLADFRKTNKSSLKNYKEEAEVKDTINGMEHASQKQTGNDGESDKVTDIGYIKAKSPVVIMILSSKSAEAANAAGTQQILQSMKKA